MIYELKSPFKEIWAKGYLREGVNGRKLLDLFNSDTCRTTISYARYLVCVDLGIFLSDRYEVDHIDNDCTNDELSNLQVLTVEEHRKKTKLFLEGRNIATCTCAFCSKSFSREVRHIRGINSFCSRSCNAKFNRANNGWLINASVVDDSIIGKIKSLRESGLSDYKISDQLSIERSRVWRIRRDNQIA